MTAHLLALALAAHHHYPHYTPLPPPDLNAVPPGHGPGLGLLAIIAVVAFIVGAKAGDRE
jgi:hypothetical protein